MDKHPYRKAALRLDGGLKRSGFTWLGK